MSAVQFTTEEGEGRLALLGELTFATVPGLSKDLESTFKQWPQLRVDLAGLEWMDSAGLALLIEWTCLARALGHSLEFVNVPRQLLTIASVSGVDQMLPLSRRQPEVDMGGRGITGDDP